MLHTPSADGPVSSLVGESSVTAQTAMHTNEAPKHVPHANVKITGDEGCGHVSSELHV